MHRNRSTWIHYFIRAFPGFVFGEKEHKNKRNYRTRPTQKVKEVVTTNENGDEAIETSDACPEPNGFFADAEQCDKYYACK